MPKNQPDYSHTIIYKLCCKDISINDIYIGHTTNFIQRKNSHKTSCCNENDKKYNQYVYKFIRNNGGFDNWSMIQIEERNCKNKRDAEAIEHYWIETLVSKLNSNKPYAMCKEEPQLYKKGWYEENKAEILEKAKENYEENKEQKLEYQKQYVQENKETVKEYKDEWYQKNKEKILAKQKETFTCECGSEVRCAGKAEHNRSIKHKTYIHNSFTLV